MIRERRPGVYEVVVYLGKDPVTKKERYRSRTVRGTKTDARRQEAALLVDVDRSEIAATTTATLDWLLEAWLEHAAPELSPSTLQGYRRYVRNHIAPGIGDLELGQVTTRRIDAFYTALRAPDAGRHGRPLSPTTIHHVHAILRRALHQAVKWGWIPTNPADNASPPTLRRAEISPPVPATIAELLDVASRDDFGFGVLVWCAATTGARRGELCALRWSDVDLEHQAVTIARALVEDAAGAVHEKDTKTHQARRIALDPVTVAILQEWRQRSIDRAAAFGAELAPGAFVFIDDDPTGARPLAPARLSARWKRVRRASGAQVRFHDLRHFAVTGMLGAGVDVRTVAGRVGHGGGGRTTLAVYAHFLETADQDAAALLAGQLDARALLPGQAAGVGSTASPSS